MPKTLFIYCSNTFLSGILSDSFFYGWDGYTPPQHREVHPIFPSFLPGGMAISDYAIFTCLLEQCASNINVPTW